MFLATAVASVFGLLSSLLAGLTPVRLGLAPVLFGGFVAAVPPRQPETG